jgi:ligand-binding sensor domain-containing protein
VKHLSVLGLALSVGAFVACNNGEEPTPPAGGEGGGGGNEGACATDGNGTVTIEVTGLPSGVDGRVEVKRRDSLQAVTETATLMDQGAGTYVVTAMRVTDDDPIVRTVYKPTVWEGLFCLEPDVGHTVTVEYEAIPSSNKLWTSNLRGFASAQFGASGDADPSVVGDAPIGKDVAFDRDGNLWSLGATLAEKMVVRVPAQNLAASGNNTFDREINVPQIECIPALKSMAFDQSGNLWLGACGGNILEIPAEALARSGDATAGTVISGVSDSADLAFDAAGNLWVATGDAILRYDAGRLAASTSDGADLTLTPRDAEDSRDLGTTGLAFDAEGDLWGFDFGSNSIFELGAPDLEGTGSQTVTSRVSFVVGVLSLLDRGAFDEGGGLWISYATDQIARLSPAQLGESSGTGDPVAPELIVTSDALDSGLRVAFFPAPEALPLYHTALSGRKPL